MGSARSYGQRYTTLALLATVQRAYDEALAPAQRAYGEAIQRAYDEALASIEGYLPRNAT